MFRWLAFLLLSPSLFAADFPLLVEIEELADHPDRNDHVIVDVRSQKEYLEGHIQGAINIPVDDTFDKSNRTGYLAGTSKLQKLFSKAGISHEHGLVLYDSGRFIDAGRLFWVLEVLGHRNLSVLNAGFSEWKQAGLPVSTTVHTLPPSEFSPAVDAKKLATTLSTRLAIGDEKKSIIDARTKAEYEGKESIASRYGHIPSAVNIPWDSVFNDRKRIRPLDELQEIFSTVDKDDRVITYCNKGKQSALTYFVLRNLGYNVSAYDGSWSEWGNNHTLPIVSAAELGDDR